MDPTFAASLKYERTALPAELRHDVAELKAWDAAAEQAQRRWSIPFFTAIGLGGAGAIFTFLSASWGWPHPFIEGMACAVLLLIAGLFAIPYYRQLRRNTPDYRYRILDELLAAWQQTAPHQPLHVVLDCGAWKQPANCTQPMAFMQQAGQETYTVPWLRVAAKEASGDGFTLVVRLMVQVDHHWVGTGKGRRIESTDHFWHHCELDLRGPYNAFATEEGWDNPDLALLSLEKDHAGCKLVARSTLAERIRQTLQWEPPDAIEELFTSKVLLEWIAWGRTGQAVESPHSS